MVDMKRMMSSCPTNGRKTSRSTPQASAYMIPNANISARIAGTPNSCRPTMARAANTTMMPWAKLKMPDALKISTKPSAIRE